MKKIGKFYEDKAIEYLNKNYYLIIDRNIRINYREIDILCIKNNITIIIEVKYRKNNIFPEISKKQKKNLTECGELLSLKYQLPKFWQIDYICFFSKKMFHFKNI